MSATEIQTTIAAKAQDLTTHLLGDDKNHDLKAQINYHKFGPDGSPANPRTYHDLSPNHHDARTATIHDVRGSGIDYTLEGNGFQYVKGFKTADIDFSNNEQVKKEHYPAMEDFVKNVTGASKVIILNHLIRNADPDTSEYGPGYKGPARRPHVDATPTFAPTILKKMAPLLKGEGQYESIVAGRWQIVNIWRPLATIKKDPLCVIDYATIPQSDLVAIDYPNTQAKELEIYYVNSGLQDGQADEELSHKWYYMHQQTPEEVLLFKTYDSDQGAKTGGVPHSAVRVDGTEDLPSRQSIEMRAFVCYSTGTT